MNRTIKSAVLIASIAAVLTGTGAYAQSTIGLDRSQARVANAAAGLPLAAASKASPQSIVNGYLQASGRGADVLASLRVTNSAVSPRGVTHVRMEQQIDGLTVYGAYAKAAVNGKGELVQVIDRLVPVTLVQPSRIDAAQAAAAAVTRLYPSQAASLRVAAVKGNTTEFASSAFFHRGPSATAVVLPLDNGTLVRGWVVETWTAKDNQLHYTVVDGNGQVLDVESRTNTDSYKVFVEDPLKSSTQTVVNGPGTAGNAQSPAGWLGTGAQTTVNIKGNNVSAYLDTDANNAADAGGTAVADGNFTTTVDLGVQPSTTGNKAVAAQNLFYLNNIVHDRLYTHGFNEANGNFQVNNFGKGGLGNDPVSAEAQDGSGTDNANFSTPADGSAPRMQMYLWNSNPQGLVTVGAANTGAYPSAFGAALTPTGVNGPLRVAAPADGCAAFTLSMTGAIAIVDRGTCDFTVKVLNAQNAGAKGVVIANNLAGGAFGPGGSNRKVKIPSGMVTQADGVTLKNLAGGTAVLKANPDALKIDGDLDSDIVFHEYGHGLTWRMIGSMSGTYAGAIGEGASDVLAFLIDGDDRIGEYAFNDPLGIRTAPYATHTKTLSQWTAGEVHTDGEIYAAAMWKVLQNYQAAGLSADDLMGDFVDGMNFTPAGPNPLQMRDGMVSSVGTDTVRKCAIWRGFAAKGMGTGASIPRRGAPVDSFALPTGC